MEFIFDNFNLKELGCTDKDFVKLDKKVDATIRKERRMGH